ALLDEPRNVSGLDDVQVDVGEARSSESIAAEAALLSGGRQRECGSRKQSLDEIAARRGDGIAERGCVRHVVVEAVRIEIASRVRRRRNDGERQTALEDGDCRELPAARDLFS